LQRGPYTPRLARFSERPSLGDLDTLVLDRRDLDDIKSCRPGDCGLKLAADEIDRLRELRERSGAAWATAVQDEFRRLMLDRAVTYLAAGHGGLQASVDRKRPESPSAEFEALTARHSFAELPGPQLTSYLFQFPHVDARNCESFLYWSQEDLGTGKRITSITHVTIVRSGHPSRPEVVIASKQVSATHYLTASLSVMAMVSGDASQRYLIYVRRSRVDLLDGALSGLVRRMMERRIRAEAPAVLNSIRKRLESGDPAGPPVSWDDDHAPSSSPSDR
jgi:hypothetical protein